jgi:hypothetical protein
VNDLDTIRIKTVEFLNDDSMRDSIARLGQSALKSGVSTAATAALVRLTCQAHGIRVDESHDYLVRHLRELHRLGLIYWPETDLVKMV